MKHPYVSSIPDGGDSTLVQPENWNDVHVIGWVTPPSSSYDVLESDDGIFITHVPADMFLPAASAQKGQTYIFKHGPGTASNNTTIIPAGGDTIEGQANYQLTVANQFVILSSDGVSNWRAIGFGGSAAASIFSATFVLSAAQLIALNGSNNLNLVTCQAGTFINVLSYTFYYKFGGAPFVPAGGWGLVVGIANDILNGNTPALLGAGFLDQSVDQLFLAQGDPGGVGPASMRDGQPIQVGLLANGSGASLSGGGTGEVQITLLYAIQNSPS